MGATMRRAVVVILGVAVLALLVARYANEIIDLALRLPLIMLDLALELLRGLASVVGSLLTDAGPFLAPLGDALSGLASDPVGSLAALVAWARDVLTALI